MVAVKGWPALSAGSVLLLSACSVMVKFSDPPDKCGDNSRQTWEECDGPDLKRASCASLGFLEGKLSCDPNCRYNTSLCDNRMASCEGYCGLGVPSLPGDPPSCWCDALCADFGDCCPDACRVCGHGCD